jgi:hypothetical protein
MTRTDLPFVKLYVANSYYYNSGMLLTNTVGLPADDDKIREKLKEIQNDESEGYVVLRGETQFRCTFPQDLDIFELNRKLKRLTDKDKGTLKLVSRPGSLSIMSVVDQVLGKKPAEWLGNAS